MQTAGSLGVVLAILVGLYVGHLNSVIRGQRDTISECFAQIMWANLAINESNSQIREVKSAGPLYQDVRHSIDGLKEQYPVSNPCAL